jgi:glyceraldehyde-3-phosphate dehydrogenase (NADP+)
VRLPAARVDALKLGMPCEEGVAVTPLPEHDNLDAMGALLDDALARDARSSIATVVAAATR